MRDRSSWHRELAGELTPVWPGGVGGFRIGDLLDVELGLFLLTRVMPTRSAGDVWTLLSGYPYGDTFGDVRTESDQVMVRRARHYLWDRSRRYSWHTALSQYLTVDQVLRGYDFADITEQPVPLQPSRAASRFTVYERLLSMAPPFEQHQLAIAGAGEHVFIANNQRYSATIPQELVEAVTPTGHDIDAAPPGKGSPIEVRWKQLEDAARTMDKLEADRGGKHNDWFTRLDRVRLLVRSEDEGAFVPGTVLRIDRLMHMVGMVGAGKSTIRDILAFHIATRAKRPGRITIVVGDVAEMLTITEQFTRLGVPAAPVLGRSTLDRNIQRLHRRCQTGTASMLNHDHPGFTWLSSACPLDALRGFEARRALRIADAPCDRLNSAPEVAKAEQEADDASTGGGPRKRPQRPKRYGCPLWHACPRHAGAVSLVDAQVWVATPASLVHSSVPAHMVREKMRYLELACRRSDLIIVDEADRVQMQLDTAFAPAATLVAQGSESWLDEVGKHKLTELANKGRLQFSLEEADDWNTAVNTVMAATDRIYSALINDEPLRRWITQDYFSAMTLHQWLLNAWYPTLVEHRRAQSDAKNAPSPEVTVDESELAAARASLARVSGILDRFRDSPLTQQPVVDEDDQEAAMVNDLVATATSLLHMQRAGSIRRHTRSRLEGILRRLVGDNELVSADLEANLTRFEFTLVLAVLHNQLNLVTTVWPRVEAALNLEMTSNVLSRRPPKDFMPIVPESPMGNVLGFQFQTGDRNEDGDQSGELRFFRCNGVGRELLLELPAITSVDDRPSPNVLLMSATSWARESSRYHLHARVDVVLRPRPEEIAAINTTEFRKEFLYREGSSTPLRLSGTDPAKRPHVLREMLAQLALPEPGLDASTSILQQELDSMPDPDRRRILLLVGSYAEAEQAGAYLQTLAEWKGNVTVLVSDDTDLDHVWHTLPATAPGRSANLHQRRGEITAYPEVGGQILIAPLLAVERGHNIVVAGGKAAIGSAYFLARPHHRPDDIALATQAINDWAVRQVRGDKREFEQLVLACGSPDAAGLRWRREASIKWHRFLTRRMSWTSLPDDEKSAFTWDQLVVIWQVIGRLVRGGVPARVYFVDAAFSPREAGFHGADTPATSLLESMRHELAAYLDAESAADASPIDRSLVKALYEPLYTALRDIT